MTVVFPVTSDRLGSEAMNAAAAALTAGRIVVVRTAAGYEPWVRPSAYGAAPARPIYFLRSSADLDDFVVPPPRAVRLAEAFWPGRLELELGPVDRPVLLSTPGRPVAAALVAALPFRPAALAPPGGPAAGASELAAAGLAAEIVLDEGPAAPTTPARWRVRDDGSLAELRAGTPSVAEGARRVPRRIVCVCTGNTCRSPMAAALLAAELARALGVAPDELAAAGYAVTSAGVSAYAGEAASFGAREAMQDRGIDLAGHRARRADATLLSEADVVFAMTEAHLSRVRASLSPARAAAAALFDPDGRDVDDPFGGDARIYRRTAERLAEIARQRAVEIVASP